jgi:hypothetical protein
MSSRAMTVGGAGVGALALLVTGVAARAAGTAGPAAETLYYGKTSQGLSVSIPVKGTQIPRDDRAYVLYRIRHSDPLEFHPGERGATSFRGGSLTFHHLAKLGGGTIEVWFQATLTGGGKVMTGTYRERDVGFSAPVSDIRARFTATAWASRSGREWRGETADGKLLRMVVRYRLAPGHVIINGRRPLRPTYSVSLPATTRPLACRNADGTTTKISASLPTLSGDLEGSDDLANSFADAIRRAGVTPRPAGLSTPTPASATATLAGTSVTAQLAVRRLAWQGAGLAATGTLSYQGTVRTEAGTAVCGRTTSAFTVRPS